MADLYRFGGPIPESVQRLKARREFSASTLHAGVKRIRRERFESERAMATASIDIPPKAGSPSPISVEHCEERASQKARPTPLSPL